MNFYLKLYLALVLFLLGVQFAVVAEALLKWLLLKMNPLKKRLAAFFNELQCNTFFFLLVLWYWINGRNHNDY